MLKKEARIFYKDKRAQLSFDEIEKQSIAIANQLLKLKKNKFWDKNLYYHLFLTIKEQREVNTEHILNILFAKDKEIIVSKSDFKTREMINYLLTENTRIKKNDYNIPEPLDGIEVPHKKIDVVFIPLLAYDKSGNRVGYGKGFYDRLLKKTDCIKVGLSLFDPIAQIEDMNNNDIPLNFCITPNTIYTF
jgi:5-formyltetrahydrofolate cyclo-ligase